MDELLKKLLEAEILSEESKKELETAFQTRLDETIENVKAETELQVRADLSAQWVSERESLIEAIEAKMNDFAAQEMKEIHEDIDRFRDLEAEYAVKLTEAKKDLSEQLESDLGELIDKLDTFLEMRLATEFDDLREDLQETRKLEFGRKIFEAFLPEYRKHFVDASATERELREAKAKIGKLEGKYNNVKKAKDDLFRKVKMEKVLQPLKGSQREVMETILANVETDKLEEGYTRFIGRVLKEQKTETKVNSKKPITESKQSEVKPNEATHSFKTGDVSFGKEMMTESYDNAANSLANEYRKLAGII